MINPTMVICPICNERLGYWATYPSNNGKYHICCVRRLVNWFVKEKKGRIDFNTLKIIIVNDVRK